jgi:hypothetical protein
MDSLNFESGCTYKYKILNGDWKLTCISEDQLKIDAMCM